MTRYATNAPDRIVVIVGPTAAGKSALAVRLAADLGGEVLSADSMQVYRRFDIGTGKLTQAERSGVPHHLIDIIEPDESFSAARFVTLADSTVAEIWGRDRLPIVVGGTGLYLRALLRGLFDAPAADASIREAHRRYAAEHGTPALHERLAAIDPETAQRVNPNDLVRVSRALEVHQQTGQPISRLRQQHAFADRRYDALIIGLRLEPDDLKRAIDARVDAMMAGGWLDEVRGLLDMGHADTHAMRALGYRQLRAHLDGEMDLQRAVQQTKSETWRFSRRQRNWFGQEPGIAWIDQAAEVGGETVRRWLEQSASAPRAGRA